MRSRSSLLSPRLLPCCRLLVLVFVTWLTACSENPDEARLQQRLDALESALQDKQPDAVMELLTAGFSTGRGEGRKDVQRLLLAQLLRNQWVGVIRSQTEITLDESYRDQASASFHALLTGGAGLLPKRGRNYRVQSRWLFQDGDWYLDRLEWEAL